MAWGGKVEGSWLWVGEIEKKQQVGPLEHQGDHTPESGPQIHTLPPGRTGVVSHQSYSLIRRCCSHVDPREQSCPELSTFGLAYVQEASILAGVLCAVSHTC